MLCRHSAEAWGACLCVMKAGRCTTMRHRFGEVIGALKNGQYNDSAIGFAGSQWCKEWQPNMAAQMW